MSGERKESEYSKKLRDPRWQKLRLEVLQRDDWACQKCFDSKSTLHVHHRWYNRGLEPWEYELSALVTLCESCHEEESSLLAGEQRALLKALARAGALSGEINALMSVFAEAFEAPLHEVEWDELTTFLVHLLIDRRAGGPLWQQVRDHAAAYWAQRAASMRDEKPGEA